MLDAQRSSFCLFNSRVSGSERETPFLSAKIKKQNKFTCGKRRDRRARTLKYNKMENCNVKVKVVVRDERGMKMLERVHFQTYFKFERIVIEAPSLK